MNRENKIIIMVLCTFLMLANCKKEKKGEYTSYEATPTTIEYPSNFPDMIIPENNKPTVERIALGRKLYYDKILSKDQTKSCSSCHIQSSSFSTSNPNSLAHINLGWSKYFLWNGAYQDQLENVMLFEVKDFLETDMQLLNNSALYKAEFKKAYGINTITEEDVARALAQFFRTLNSYNSKYDKWLRGEVAFTPKEMDGYDIFNTERGDCFHCHGTVLMHDNSFGNNGLDNDPDPGLYIVTGDMNDYGKFKTPTLRNIELTAPYMHDGRFQTLEEVIEFYSTGVQQDSPNLSPLMKYAHQGGVQIPPQDVENLVAFLKTFTDHDFINNPELSNPN